MATVEYRMEYPPNPADAIAKKKMINRSDRCLLMYRNPSTNSSFMDVFDFSSISDFTTLPDSVIKSSDNPETMNEIPFTTKTNPEPNVATKKPPTAGPTRYANSPAPEYSEFAFVILSLLTTKEIYPPIAGEKSTSNIVKAKITI